MKACTNLTDVKEEVNRVIEEYNECRYQWRLKRMAPVQYRDHLLAIGTFLYCPKNGVKSDMGCYYYWGENCETAS
ncbi:IS3 family transposase [Peribacillus frigoritolerans]|uniref:IS3 family transposase n=1 Tax=Peribacillus frigoritolerans TaxID=450367 RepID=UPI003D08A265